MRKLITIKKAMLDRGLSCMETARMIGLNPSRFSLILNGWVEPTDKFRKRILEIFPDAVDDLLVKEGV